jgi:hypothetical protein
MPLDFVVFPLNGAVVFGVPVSGPNHELNAFHALLHLSLHTRQKKISPRRHTDSALQYWQSSSVFTHFSGFMRGSPFR